MRHYILDPRLTLDGDFGRDNGDGFLGNDIGLGTAAGV